MKKIKFKLGKYIVSDDNPVCFVAEAGSFFNDNINLAKEYLNLSAEAKVDFFKTEILHSSDVVLKDTKDLFKYPSGKSGKNINVENYRNFIERKVMSLSSYLKLFEHAKKIKLPIIATVFDNIGVDFLKSQGAAAIKISRNNIQHKILIEYAAKSGLPIIFDLGHVPIWKALRALKWVKKFGGRTMFNYHPGKAIAQGKDHQFNLINNLKKKFKTPIGLSCHYRGEEMIYTAIGAGCNLIEKGVDKNPSRKEADLVSAVSFKKLSNLVKKVKDCSDTMIAKKDLIVKESKLKKTWMGAVANSNLNIGDRIKYKDIFFSWPPKGILPYSIELVLGKKLKKKIKRGEPIKWKHFHEKKN